MAQAVFDIQGYSIVLNKVSFITRVFHAENGEGFQFNIRFSDQLVLPVKLPARHEAELQRGLVVAALKEA
jgi:hypothetical protein